MKSKIINTFAFVASLTAVVGVTAYFVDRLNAVEASILRQELDRTIGRYEIQVGLLQNRQSDLEATWKRVADACDEVSNLIGSRLIERNKEMSERLADAFRTNAEVTKLLASFPGLRDEATDASKQFRKYESEMVEAIDAYENWHATVERAFELASESATEQTDETNEHLLDLVDDLNSVVPIEATNQSSYTIPR